MNTMVDFSSWNTFFKIPGIHILWRGQETGGLPFRNQHLGNNLFLFDFWNCPWLPWQKRTSCYWLLPYYRWGYHEDGLRNYVVSLFEWIDILEGAIQEIWNFEATLFVDLSRVFIVRQLVFWWWFFINCSTADHYLLFFFYQYKKFQYSWLFKKLIWKRLKELIIK